MIKLIAALSGALLMTSQALSAEPLWHQVVRNSRANGYIDINNMHRKGDVVSYWLIWDYPDATNPKNPSLKGFNDINCVENKITTKQLVIYNEHMAKGAPIDSQTYTDGNFTYVVPGTIEETVRDFACK